MRTVSTLLRLGLFGVIAGVIVADSNATDYFVRRGGNDRNNGRSHSAAFKTIKKAARVARAGDSVHVGAGTYSDKVSISNDGTSSRPIKFIADKSGSKTGDGGTVTVSNEFEVDGDNYIHVIGFTFTRKGIEWEESTGGLLKDCQIVNCDDDGVSIDRATLTIEECLASKNDDDGFDVKKSTVTIRKCKIVENGDDGIDVEEGSTVTVEDCNIALNRSSGIDAMDDKNKKLTVRRCRIAANRKDGVDMEDVTALFDSCLVLQNGDDGIDCDEDSKVRIVHCTIVNNSDKGIVGDENGSATVRNCILAFNKYGIDVDDRKARIDHDYNLFYRNQRDLDGTSRASNELVADPRFVSSLDFHQTPTSPAVDRGVNGLSTLDLDGKKRPAGARADLGCYERSAPVSNNYYVSTRGNDNNDGRSAGRPFRTINKAAGVVIPGSKVYVAAGTYNDAPYIRKAGTKSQPISFIAQGNVVVRPASKKQWSLQLHNADHTAFEGFRFSGAGMTVAFGIYNYHSDVTFKDCEFDRLQHGLYGAYGGVQLEGCNFHNNSGYSVLNYYGGLLVKDCKFTNNDHGPYSHRDHKFDISDSTIEGNRSWALMVGFQPQGDSKPFGVGTPTVTNCKINNNGDGLYLIQAREKDRINFQKTTFKGTKGWEMQLAACDLTVTSRWRAQFPIEKGGSGIVGYKSNLDVRDIKFEGYKQGWGFLDYYGTLTMQDVTARDNQFGVGVYGPQGFKANDCKIVGNGGPKNAGWGLRLWTGPKGEVALYNTEISNNGNGAWLHGVNRDNFKLHNTTIADNTSHGLYLDQSTAEFSTRTMDKQWKLRDNGYNITAYMSKARFDGITLSDAKHWAVLSYYSDIRARNCNFTKNGNGFYAYFNKSFEVANTKFDGNKNTGLLYGSNGQYYGYVKGRLGWHRADGPGKIANCSLSNNLACGIQLYGVTPNTLRMTGTPIEGNRVAGVYANRSRIDFNPSTMRETWRLKNNGSHIYAAYGQYRFHGIELSDAKSYGVATWYSDVRVKDCKFNSNGSSGFQSYYNKSFHAEGATFAKNQWSGVNYYSNGTYYGHKNGRWGWHKADGPGKFKDCLIEKNKHYGMFAQDVNNHSLRLADTPIRGNGTAGLYAYRSELTFTPEIMNKMWQLSGNGSHIYGGYGKYKFDGVELSGAPGYGAATWYSKVAIRDSKFAKNGRTGFQSYFNKALRVEGSKFAENGWSGINYYGNGTYYGLKDGKWGWYKTDGPGELNDCVVEKNTHYGVYIGQTTNDALTASNTVIRGHGTAGIYAYRSELDFTGATMRDMWQLSDNRSHIYAGYGKYRFDGVELSDAKAYGAATWYSEVGIKDSKFAKNGATGFQSYFNKSLEVKDSKFTENDWSGVNYYSDGKYYGLKDGKWGWHEADGAGEFKDSLIEKNKHYGMHVGNSTNGSLRLSNTPIRDHGTAGLYAYRSELDFTADSMPMWQFSGNRSNIYLGYGKYRFDDVDVSGAKAYGVASWYSDIDLKNSTFADNGYAGLQSYYNKSLKIDGSRFATNGSWGLMYYSNGKYYGLKDGKSGWYDADGPAEITNSSISENKLNGLYLAHVTDDRINISDTKIAKNGGVGVYFSHCKMALSPETQGKWNVTENVHGFGATQSQLAVTDFEVTGNKKWGMYASYSTVDLKNAKFHGNGNGMYWSGTYSKDTDEKLTVENCQFDNNTGHYGLLTYWGPTEIENSTFNGNKGDGLYTVYNKSVKVEGCEAAGNGGWGVRFFVNYPETSNWQYKDRFQENVQTLNNVSIDGNHRGLYIYNAKDAHFGLQNTKIANNQYQSIQYNHCDMLVKDQKANNWTLDGNGYGPYATGGSDVLFRDVVNAHGKYYGFLNSQSKTTLENCTCSGSRYGFYQYRPSEGTKIINSRFDGVSDTKWGWAILSYGGSLTAINNIFNGFSNGAYTYTYGNEPETPVHSVYQNTFADVKRQYGYYLPNGTASVHNNVFTGTGSGYGLGRGSSGQLSHSHNLIHNFASPFLQTDDPDAVLNSPRFVNAAAGDYHLAKGSPAINAGKNVSSMISFDKDLNPRPLYKVFDIGSYEYTQADGSFRVLNWEEKKDWEEKE
jgi:hypothetical protein